MEMPVLGARSSRVPRLEFPDPGSHLASSPPGSSRDSITNIAWSHRPLDRAGDFLAPAAHVEDDTGAVESVRDRGPLILNSLCAESACCRDGPSVESVRDRGPAAFLPTSAGPVPWPAD